MSRYSLKISDNAQDLARLASGIIADSIGLTLLEQPRCAMALAGGSTPAATYAHLGLEHLAWDRVDLLLGDERWVDLEDEASNAGMVRRTLMAGEPASKACLHPVPTHLKRPDAAAKAYEELLGTLGLGQPPRLDLVLLGLGDDGHTASLFPGTEASGVIDRWVTVGMGKGRPRVTMTAPLLSAARRVIFLVAGRNKRQALTRLLDADADSALTPAKLVATREEILILCDKAAMG